CAMKNYSRSRTSFRPASTLSRIFSGRALTLLVRIVRSIVISCETLITEALGSPDSDLFRRTLPGASARARLDVMTATITVEIRLALKAFACTTSTGRLYPGPEPCGEGSDAHQTSPRLISPGFM